MGLDWLHPGGSAAGPSRCCGRRVGIAVAVGFSNLDKLLAHTPATAGGMQSVYIFMICSM